MKNIVILGVARSGKTTLANMIIDKYKNYQIINGDCIRTTFQKVFPEIEINKFGGRGMKTNYAYFCSELLKNEIQYNKSNFRYVFESCDVTPENASKFFKLDNTRIIFLGYPKLSVDEIIFNYKNYAKEDDYMLKKSEEEIKDRAILWLQKSKKYQKECQRFNIEFIDVSYNRKFILDTILNQIYEK